MHPDHYAVTLQQETYPYFAYRSKDIEEAKKWQHTFRRELENLLGIPNIAARGTPPMTAELKSTEQQPDHVRELWSLETEPGFHLPFYVLKPLEPKADKLPIVITPHGHGKLGKKTYVGISESEADRKNMEEGERDIALQAVREGYIAIAPDMRGFASLRLEEDRERDANHSCYQLQLRAYMYGRTLIGDRVWDMMRLIDWASERDDVDSNHIVMTGNSGGGMITLFASAMDERVSISIPGCYYCTFQDSILAMRHCPCNYVPGLSLRAEMWDVAGLIAPRPFLAVAGREDPIFPIEGTKHAYEQLKNIYETFDAADVCELSIGEGGHRYYKKDVWPFVKRIIESA